MGSTFAAEATGGIVVKPWWLLRCTEAWLRLPSTPKALALQCTEEDET